MSIPSSKTLVGGAPWWTRWNKCKTANGVNCPVRRNSTANTARSQNSVRARVNPQIAYPTNTVSQARQNAPASSSAYNNAENPYSKAFHNNVLQSTNAINHAIRAAPNQREFQKRLGNTNKLLNSKVKKYQTAIQKQTQNFDKEYDSAMRGLDRMMGINKTNSQYAANAKKLNAEAQALVNEFAANYGPKKRATQVSNLTPQSQATMRRYQAFKRSMNK